MLFPVTRDPRNHDEIILLDLREVVSVQTWERSVIFHTLDGEYYPVTPKISTLEKHLEPIGFRRLDRTNLANIHKIKKFDDELMLVFFEDTITKNSKFATVSHGEKSMVKKEIAGWINANKRMQEEG